MLEEQGSSIFCCGPSWQQATQLKLTCTQDNIYKLTDQEDSSFKLSVQFSPKV